MTLRLLSKRERIVDKPAYKINTTINTERKSKLTSWEVFSQLTRINFYKNKVESVDVMKPPVRLIAGA